MTHHLTLRHICQKKLIKPILMMGIIRRTFEYLDDKCFSTVFKSLVRPHIEYANQVWSPYLMKHITALENVQRRSTKLIPGYIKNWFIKNA